MEKPELLQQLGEAAQNKAKTRPWSVYGEELVQTLQQEDSNNRIICQ
jgi:hypothetical protein